MLSSCKTCIISLVRERTLLWGTLRVNVDGLNLTWIFSGQWLEAHMDSATVMNNCRWIFDFMDARGLMQMPAHAHEERGVMAMLGIRVCGEYRENPASRQRGNSAFLETGAYAEFLERQLNQIGRASCRERV